MNKLQVKTLIKAVRTDLELFQLTEQGHYLARAANGLERLKKWKIEQIIKDPEYTVNLERMQWML